MKAFERYLAVFDDQKRKKLDRVPTFVQYTRKDFIQEHRNILNTKFEGAQKVSRFNSPLMWSSRFYYTVKLGFDSMFTISVPSVRVKPIAIETETGRKIRIGESGQAPSKNEYYQGGYLHSIETLEKLRNNMKIWDVTWWNRRLYSLYNKISDYFYPILQVGGIFDRVWTAMGMELFSRHFRKKSLLYRELVQFYADIAYYNVHGMIDAIQSLGKECKVKVINLLDDVAFKGRPMISPSRWKEDFFPHYKKITSLISDAGLIPQLHTDGDVTQLVSYFQEAGFLGLQGWEGGADPIYINKHFPDFVIIGFGDVSDILPFGKPQDVENHVLDLMNALKDNRHFIIGPSTVLYRGIPLKNVSAFIRAANKYGKYN